MFRDLRFMLGFDVDVFTKICWVVITPLALLAIFIYSLAVFRLPTYDGNAYPQSAYICGWILTSVAVGVVPICFAHTFSRTPGDTLLQVGCCVFWPVPYFSNIISIFQRIDPLLCSCLYSGRTV
ncbi:hypothetical protein O3P69_019090 [Scylla paramamosain]